PFLWAMNAEASDASVLLIGIVLVLGAVALVSRLSGPGILWIGLAWPIYDLARHERIDPSAISMLVAAPVAVLVAIAVLRMRPAKLAHFGITPWAPSDLALVPIGVGVAMTSTIAFRSGIGSIDAVFGLVGGIALAAALAEVLALVTLDRRLRAAEARAALGPVKK
ncbi:MAG: hypothetical protein ACRELB_06410, partial [Polyangiaceae bacterium]